ncbi:MAG: hypothetical protein WBV33_20780 [Terracidiphilus sp.]
MRAKVHWASLPPAASTVQRFDGRQAKVEYAESPDKTVDGQVISVELHK